MLGTAQLVERLREEGYTVGPNYLAYLLREGVVPKPNKAPGGALVWDPPCVAALRAELLRRNRGPQASLADVR